MNYSTRKAIAQWITDVKSPEARARRAEQIAERLLATMEAERELPPVLQAEFARDPRARIGWQRMSPSRRRAELLAIFYYRSPEARARRLARTIHDAVACAEKHRISHRHFQAWPRSAWPCDAFYVLDASNRNNLSPGIFGGGKIKSPW